jgi:hypothetical protein
MTMEMQDSVIISRQKLELLEKEVLKLKDEKDKEINKNKIRIITVIKEPNSLDSFRRYPFFDVKIEHEGEIPPYLKVYIEDLEKRLENRISHLNGATKNNSELLENIKKNNNLLDEKLVKLPKWLLKLLKYNYDKRNNKD